MTDRLPRHLVWFVIAGSGGAIALSVLALLLREQWHAAALAGLAALVALVFAAMLLGLLGRLEEGELWLHTLVRGAPDAIFIVDSAGQIGRSNPASARMFGYREGALAGRSFVTLLPADSGIDEPVERLGFAAVLHRLGIRGTESGTVEGLRRDGSRFHMDISVNVIEIEDEPVYTVIARDVSERIRTQEALKEAHDTLEARVEARTAELRAQMEARMRIEAQREKLVEELRVAVSQIRTLRGLLPICASCKRVRDDGGYWQQIESYVRDHSEAEFSHGICPTCMEKLYPELNRKKTGEIERG